MRPTVERIAYALVLWIVLSVAQLAGGSLLVPGGAPLVQDGPLSAGAALIVASGADAIILTLLADRMGLRGFKLGVTLGAVLFGVQTGQALIEVVAFNLDLHVPSASLAAIAAAAIIRDCLTGLVVALLWRRNCGSTFNPRGLGWKVPLVAVLYVCCYFCAGAMIAWQSAAVRAFYAHVGQISLSFLAGLQGFRGLVWCGLAWLLVRHLRGPAWQISLLVGLTFSGFMAPQLLSANPAMPWPVRSVHMVELALSNFLFGALAALILRAGKPSRGATVSRAGLEGATHLGA